MSYAGTAKTPILRENWRRSAFPISLRLFSYRGKSLWHYLSLGTRSTCDASTVAAQQKAAQWRPNSEISTRTLCRTFYFKVFGGANLE